MQMKASRHWRFPVVLSKSIRKPPVDTSNRAGTNREDAPTHGGDDANPWVEARRCVKKLGGFEIYPNCKLTYDVKTLPL